ncbi:MAG: amino acid permease, partial [Clostridia bacterium]|nr:amino acid permease [Clostridia bacterium]
FKQVDPATNMPSNSGMIGLFISALWLLFFYGSQLGEPWFGPFSFDSSELPIITTYAMYLPIFVNMFIKGKDLGVVKGKIAPVLAIIGSIFMVIAAVFAHGVYPYQAAQANGTFSLPVLFYLITYVVIMAIGAIFMKAKKNK